MAVNDPHHPYIGVFDSGIGGLSVANAIYGLLPRESIYYYADTAHVPYGPRSRDELRSFALAITRHLLERGAKIIVLACNTATGAALDHLRQEWPDVPFVGMEPAVKPAAQATRSGKVGVLATQATINSERYASLMHRYAAGVEVFENPCIGLVPLIEAGRFNHPDTQAMLENIVRPMLERGVDTLVLGCTHYPFILPALRKITGPAIQLIDPAPAVARQVARRLDELDQLVPAPLLLQPRYRFYASGAVGQLSQFTTIPFVRSQEILS
jgi:glutamate racemase